MPAVFTEGKNDTGDDKTAWMDAITDRCLSAQSWNERSASRIGWRLGQLLPFKLCGGAVLPVKTWSRSCERDGTSRALRKGRCLLRESQV